MHTMTPEEKAYLISIGSASIDEALSADLLPAPATAGPGAGGSSIFIRSGDRRVRLSINPASPLRVVPDGDGIAVVRDGEKIVRGRLERPLCHCPEQAYITVSERCIFDCKFCPVPKLGGAVKDTETVLGMVEEAARRGNLSAISLTSGVGESPEQEVERMAAVVRALRARFDLPIGVSVYPTAGSTGILRAAGADEI
ncbi:MAG: hypothetical protein PWR21_1952, partial [Methanoculleus sp.]|nr:hypothetical protein [Methanoculleus sp.]